MVFPIRRYFAVNGSFNYSVISLNYRLLLYKLSTFDYSKLNNNAYVKRKYNSLLLNYYFNRTHNVKKTVHYSKKLSGANWFRILIDIGVVDSSTDKHQFYKEIINKRCKECNKLIIPKNTFCSVQCLNINKSKNPDFIKKLSSSVKLSHSTLSKQEKQLRKQKISAGVLAHNAELSAEHKKKYSNTTLRYTAFESLTNRFPRIRVLFNSEFFYSNKYLPVECTVCGFRWDMTKTTTLSRTLCRKCVPYNKHKTQTEIFDYVNSIVHCTENDKSIISNELDIYCADANFAIEYNGLLPHSYGNSKILYYNTDYSDIDEYYHLRKTQECEDKGIELWHIYENEFLDKRKRKIWFNKIDKRLEQISIITGGTIQEISKDNGNKFMEKYHLDGSDYSDYLDKFRFVPYGIFINDLVSVMIFVEVKENKWEIIRYTDDYSIVKRSAERLIKSFQNKYKPRRLTVKCSKSRPEVLYSDLGFKLIESGELCEPNKPNCYYFKINENILYKTDNSEMNIRNKLSNGFRVLFDSSTDVYIKEF